MKNGKKKDPEVIIVGTGFAGLAMGIQLKKAGISNFVILERADSAGGTWRDNDYPGCACDIPSMLYSFSFEPNGNWTRAYPTQPEIRDYLQNVAKKYKLEPHIRYDSEIAEADYDEPNQRWHVRTTAGDTYTGRFLVSGMGGLSNPSTPVLPGIESFPGKSFHSATWDYSVPLDGKDVAVIGTGASAIQFVPQIAPRVGKLSLFQRTPPWIAPKLDYQVSALQQTLRRYMPGYSWALRKLIYWLLEVRAIGFQGNRTMLAFMESISRGHLQRQIADPILRSKVMPEYQFGCKRVLISNDYYPALLRPNVDVVTSGVSHVDGEYIVTSDGVRHHADVIVYGTGFRAQDPISPVNIVGANGVSIADAWRDGMEAFYGISIAGFPNFFMLVGPNTGLGHNSMVLMIEAQVRYVINAIKYLRKQKGGAIDVKRDVQDAFNEQLQGRLGATVWNGGCKSWYLDASGKNTTLWPGFTFAYRRETKKLEPDRYQVHEAPNKRKVTAIR